MEVAWTISSPTSEEEEPWTIYTREYLSESSKESNLSLIPAIWEEDLKSVIYGWVEEAM